MDLFLFCKASFRRNADVFQRKLTQQNMRRFDGDLAVSKHPSMAGENKPASFSSFFK